MFQRGRRADCSSWCPRAGCAGERYLARGKHVAASCEGNMLAATRGDPERAVERNDECERLVQLGSSLPGQPAVKNSAGADIDRLHGWTFVLEFCWTDVAIPARISHRGTVASRSRGRRASLRTLTVGELDRADRGMTVRLAGVDCYDAKYCSARSRIYNGPHTTWTAPICAPLNSSGARASSESGLMPSTWPPVLVIASYLDFP